MEKKEVNSKESAIKPGCLSCILNDLMIYYAGLSKFTNQERLIKEFVIFLDRISRRY